MVFRPKDGKVFKLRVSDNAGHSAILSTGTDDELVAEDVERMVKGFRAQRKWAWLTLLATKQVKLAAAYDAFVSGTIEAFMTAAQQSASDPDLDAWIRTWAAAKDTKPKYVTQVRELFPGGQRFPLSQFKPKRIKALLMALEVGASTRLKYKAAVSSLAKFLLDQEALDGHIETNPVWDIELPAAPRPDKALRCLSPAQAKKLVLAQSGEQQVIEAIMAGTGAEWQAVGDLVKEDIDLEHRLIHARGTKTARFGSFRDRWVEVTEDYCWTIIERWVRTLMPGTRLFRKGERKALWWHNKTAAEIKLPKTTLHQYRHTFARMWIDRGILGQRRDGRDLAWAKNQLGHAPESQVFLTTYAVEIKAYRLTEQQKARMRAEEKQA